MDSGQKQGWRGAVSEGFLKVAAGDGGGVSALGREKSLRQILEGEALGGDRYRGRWDGARGGQGSGRTGWSRLGAWQGQGMRQKAAEGHEGVCAQGVVRSILGANQQASHQEGHRGQGWGSRSF